MLRKGGKERFLRVMTGTQDTRILQGHMIFQSKMPISQLRELSFNSLLELHGGQTMCCHVSVCCSNRKMINMEFQKRNRVKKANKGKILHLVKTKEKYPSCGTGMSSFSKVLVNVPQISATAYSSFTLSKQHPITHLTSQPQCHREGPYTVNTSSLAM